MRKLMKKVCNWKVFKVKGELKVVSFKTKSRSIIKFLVWCKEWKHGCSGVGRQGF